MGLQAATGLTAVETVERLLRRARDLSASDLHLDPTETGLVAAVRRDGLLEPLETLPSELHPRVVGRLKALADLLAYRTDVPQEGRIPADRTDLRTEIRVATYPTVNGERAFDQPEGVLLLTGPSGSGKTTTLYAALARLLGDPDAAGDGARRRRAIMTVEDPVERRVRGVA